MSSLVVNTCHFVVNTGNCSTFKTIERYICWIRTDSNILTMTEIFTSTNVKILCWEFDDFPLHDSSFSGGGHNSSSSPLFLHWYCKENLCFDHTQKMLRFVYSRCVAIYVELYKSYTRVIQVIHEWQFGRTRNNVETCKCRSGILFPLLFQVLSNFASVTTEKEKSLVHFDYQQMYYFTLSLSMSVVILPVSPHPTPLPVN